MDDRKALGFALLSLKHMRKAHACMEQSLKKMDDLEVRKTFFDELYLPMKAIITALEVLE